MKVFFIVPPADNFIESYVTKKLDKGREFRQKLGILYVAGALREYCGVTPKIIDCVADGLDIGELSRIVTDEKPDVVGFSVLTFNLLDCLAAAKAVKDVNAGIKVCFGGFHVSLYPEETLALANVDYIVFGEGEITFSEFIKHLIEGKTDEEHLKNIDGFGFKSRTGVGIVNNARKPISNLDDLPLPAHDLIDMEKYTFVLAEEGKVGAIQTSRGCPSKCVFCDIRLTKYRYRSEENVLREIKFLTGMGIKEIFIIDDTFTINKDRVLRLCNLLINEKLGIRFKISSRIDRIDEEMLKALAKAGCYRIHYGVESGSQRILDYLQKEITVEQITRVVGWTKKAGMDVFAYMMVGIPTETLEDMEQSHALVKRLLPDHVNYSICTPFPKTYLYESTLKDRKNTEDYWLEFAKKPDSQFKIRTMNEYFDESQLREMQDLAIRKFYSSPKVILRELAKTKSLKQLMLKAKMGMRLFAPR